MTINRHVFHAQIPLEGSGSRVDMDGNRLKELRKFNISSAHDDITVVEIEMAAASAVELVAMVSVKLLEFEKLNGVMGTILAESLSENCTGHQYRGRMPAGSPLDLAARRFLELLIENSGVIE